MSESVIYCEGYHDRAFWTGWLRHLGCVDPGSPPAGKSGRIPIVDPWKTPVKGGQYAFRSHSGRFIRVVPSHGKDNILRLVRTRLKEKNTKSLTRLVINIDPDLNPAVVGTGPTGLRQQDVLREVRQFDPAAAPNAEGEIEMDGGATKVSLIRWETNDPPAPGLPEQQTLERLVSAALAAANPARAKAVQDWLNSRPIPPGADPKEHAWSYMAGWYADKGCEAFYANLWNEPHVAIELQSRLQQSGAWQIAQTLAG